ncbi:class I SAM-dependent methyltransferase, partial [Candidatus Bathyarchaeota archaeon]|nr:class I SAM-dependent methyltransferase [Candidatus Bathyarchaeota archaeon]
FDLSKHFLASLTAKNREEGLYENLNPIQGDMRRLPFKPGSFDNAINFYTSFGYFNDEENQLVL